MTTTNKTTVHFEVKDPEAAMRAAKSLAKKVLGKPKNKTKNPSRKTS